MSDNTRIGRRGFLRGMGLAGGALAVAGLLQACGTAATPAAPTAAPAPTTAPVAASQTQAPLPLAPTPSTASVSAPADWQQQWDAIQAGAKKEGKLSLIVPPGDIYRTFADFFQNKYGIQTELLVGNGTADLQAKVDAERKAGQYNWDVITHSPGVMLVGMGPINALDTLAPSLILPEVLDDSTWFKGFQYGWADLKQSTVYGFVGYAANTAKVNRAILPESQLSTLDQLWDPQWKGKIAMFDPRIDGAGLQVAAVWLITMGEQRLTDFFKNQAPVLTQDRRQLAAWMIDGSYPIALGVSADGFAPLAQQGVDVSVVQPLDASNPHGLYMSLGTGSVSLISRAPHPNAAKLFVNWLLTQEGQTQWSQTSRYDMRRLDVPVFDPALELDPGTDYVFIDNEQNYSLRNRANELAKQLLS